MAAIRRYRDIGEGQDDTAVWKFVVAIIIDIISRAL